METPVFSTDILGLEDLNPKDAVTRLTKEQPHITSALFNEYARLPKLALITYHLLCKVVPEPRVTISQETVEALSSIIETDKAKLGAELIKEQPNFGNKVKEGYDYIPKPLLMVYFGYKQQAEANEMQGSNLFKELTEEEKHLRYLIQQVYQSLPSNKDWLDPVLEAEMKDIANA